MLYYGAEWLVKGSSSLARSLGVTPVVVGLTVVAFGTSAPEMVVSVVASIEGRSMIAVGNVIGSNICNIALILGMAAVLQPLACNRSVIRRDMPIMLGVSLYLLLVSYDSILGRLEGATLFGGIILYILFNCHIAIKEAKQAPSIKQASFQQVAGETGYITSRKKQIALIVVGIVVVVTGAQIAVHSAVEIMLALGVSERFIGLTMVAIGTSLPELAASIVAALKKEMDISIGNLIGSNVFNILGVLGIASLIRPIIIPYGFVQSSLLIDYMVMVFISFLPWLMMRRGYTITRKGGLILLSCYIGYITYLILTV